MTFAQIPIAELSLAEAANASTDGGEYWKATMPAVLFHYGISRDEYWRLEVWEHAALVDYLAFRGVPLGVSDGG